MMLRRAGVVALVSLWSCASGLTRVVHEPVAPLEVTTVFVYRTRLAGTPDTTARSTELSQRLITTALDETGDTFAFYGPSEFTVTRWDDDAAWVASNALPLLTMNGGRPDQGLVLRPRVERRVSGSLQSAQDTKGVNKGTSSNEVTTWLGTVEVLHPATRVVLAEVQGSVEVDAFESPTAENDFDEAPKMTHLMERLTRDALRLVKKHAKPRDATSLPSLSVAITPQALPVVVEGETLHLDALQAELLLQNRARFLCDGLTDAEAAKTLAMPAGLLVRSSGSDKLHPGDLILSVEGEPALPQVIERARFIGHPVQLHLKTASGANADVVYP